MRAGSDQGNCLTVDGPHLGSEWQFVVTAFFAIHFKGRKIMSLTKLSRSPRQAPPTVTIVRLLAWNH